ncbi:hypothetical protein PIB30_088518 [Stylosanthes scabra]|uniref:Uncharacterized protein n=1 Tax=Stylosanthes scabra TaxID=79078 RepID=A0ABU6VUX0_9FABA|nr:hypothetical protein [Stylosanthes scabra]
MRARRTPTRNKTTASRNINQAQEEATPQPEPIIHPSPEAMAAETVVDVPVATNSQTSSASSHGAAAPTEIPTQQPNNIKKSKRASYKRPPPTGQKFVHGKRGEAPKIFVPRVSPDATDSDDDSDADPDYHQYESEDLHSPLSSDCDDECHLEDEVWPQSNPEARFGLVHLELGMEFATMKEFQRAVGIFNIQLGRSIKFSRKLSVILRIVPGLSIAQDLMSREATKSRLLWMNTYVLGLRKTSQQMESG